MWVWIVFLSLEAALIGHGEAEQHKLPNGGEIKAVLVAGSKFWENYRHQADICHAYQILIQNGIPEENIIVMMYDDIAYNEKNPDKGVIINRPGGPNVYKNVKIDYTKGDVNSEVFQNVLLGNKAAVKGRGTGRVLESGPNDHVFINFVDHGIPHGLCFPKGYIDSSTFLGVLEKMANTSRFQKMFLYIEACYSGSMFNKILPDNLNIFVVTSANTNESSWSCFPSSRLQTPLGDMFSIYWMQDADLGDMRKESVQEQFLKVRGETTLSHVSEYGDNNISNTKLNEVIGYNKQPPAYYKVDCNELIAAHQVPVVILKNRIQAAKNLEEKKKLEKELKDLMLARKDVEKFFMKLVKELITGNEEYLYQQYIAKRPAFTSNLACYETAVAHLHRECFKINDPFIGTQLHTLINLCDAVPEAQVVEKIKSICSKKSVKPVL